MNWGPLTQFCREVCAINVATEGELTDDGLVVGKPLYVRLRAGEKVSTAEKVDGPWNATGEEPGALLQTIRASITERKTSYKVFLVEALQRGGTSVVKHCPPIYSDVDVDRENGLVKGNSAADTQALALVDLSKSIDRRAWDAISELKSLHGELSDLRVENKQLEIMNGFLIGTIRDLEGSFGDQARIHAINAFKETFAPLVGQIGPLLVAKLAQSWGFSQGPNGKAGGKKKPQDGQAPPPPPPADDQAPPPAEGSSNVAGPLEELTAIVARTKALLEANPELATHDVVIAGFGDVVEAHPALKGKLIERFMAAGFGA